MLTELRIENLGVIADLSLVFGPGMTALTGETGAGKTMLVEAIELLVGGRADATLVRPGAAEAVVEGRFELDGREVVLARVLPADGRSRAYLDGRLATVTTVAEAGASLVDLHGQHAHQSLLSAAAQRQSLDRFAGVDLGPLRTARQRIADLDAALAALGGDARARAREIDLLRYQVDELARAGISGPDEEDRLEREEDVLADASCLPRGRGACRRRASSTRAVRSTACGAALAAIQARSPFADAAERLRAAAAELDDLAAALRDQGEAIEEDPARLAWLGERRHFLRELRRKYGDTLADVIAYGDEAEARLAELEGFEGRAAVLEAERAAAVADEAAAARRSGQLGARPRRSWRPPSLGTSARWPWPRPVLRLPWVQWIRVTR